MRLFRLVALGIPTAVGAQAISVTKTSETFSRAQVTAWVPGAQIAVARWDGTLTIFREPHEGEFGPVLTQVLAVPTLAPVEALIPISSVLFATSNGSASLALWKLTQGVFKLAGTFAYDSSLGVAESGAVLTAGSQRFLVSGHAGGSIVVWRIDRDSLRLVRTVSLRSSQPVPSPYQLWNIRGIVAWGDGKIVTGSEDGDVVLYDVVNDRTLTRRRYNPTAKRGINSLAVVDDYLLVTNCSVGSDDKNLWLYKITNDSIAPLDAVNLVKDATLRQVFDFDAQLARFDGETYFLASTEEGLVWLGTLTGNKLAVVSNLKLADVGGAALSTVSDSGVFSAVAFDVDLLKLSKGARKH